MIYHDKGDEMNQDISSNFEKEAASPYLNNVAPSKMKRLEGEQTYALTSHCNVQRFFTSESHLLKKRTSAKKNCELRQKEVIFPTKSFFLIPW